mgnify:CR=1 FL=1
MIVKCKINKTYYENNNGKFEIFGLIFYEDGNENNIVKIVDGLFTSYEKIEKFQQLINSNDLDELHIIDVCEDAILDYELKITDLIMIA